MVKAVVKFHNTVVLMATGNCKLVRNPLPRNCTGPGLGIAKVLGMAQACLHVVPKA